MTASVLKKYEHFNEHVNHSESVISGAGQDGQIRLIARVNKWIRPSRIPRETRTDYDHRILNEQDRFSKYRSHLLVAQRFDTSSSRLVAVSTSIPRIGYAWMPILANGKNKPISYQVSKAFSIWLNSTLGRICFRRVTARKISYPLFNPVAFDGIPFPDIDNPIIVETLVSCFDETCEEIVPQFCDGRTPIREAWDDAVSSALSIDRDLIAKCAEMLSRDSFVSKEAFYDAQ